MTTEFQLCNKKKFCILVIQQCEWTHLKLNKRANVMLHIFYNN